MRKLCRTIQRPPFTHVYYMAPTLKRAKEIIWNELDALNVAYALGGTMYEQTGVVRFKGLPGKPEIRLGGFNSKTEIEKVRGDVQAPNLIVCDESQSVRPSILSDFVDNIAEPALADYNGTLVMSGTPGAVCAGFWYDITAGNMKGQWKNHRLSLLDNVFLHRKRGMNGEDILAAVLKRRNIDEKNPTYMREWLGLWVDDPNALVWKHFDVTRNTHPAVDKHELLRAMNYWGMAFDLGFEDADAWGDMGWKRNDKKVWSVLEEVETKQAITPLGIALSKMYNARDHSFLIGDLGALGKKIGAELKYRWQLPVEAADKTRKAEHIELLNDAMLQGNFSVQEDSVSAEEAHLIQWDSDARAKGELKISPNFHSDVWDKNLYGFRKCMAFHEEPVSESLPMEDRLASQRFESVERKKNLSDEEEMFEEIGFDVS